MYTKSSGRMSQGTTLTWERWGMYDEDSPSTVEFRIIPCPYHDGTAYLRVVETGHGPRRQPGQARGRIHGGLHLCAERVEGRAGA
ncbi:hypothetical protein MAJ_07122, partial [Metarhizium majus ARSEF 297]